MTVATQQKWRSTAGPRMTKQVNEALNSLNWHGKGRIVLRGVVGGQEHSRVLYQPFGPVNPAVLKALEEIGDHHDWHITGGNYKAIIQDCKDAVDRIALPVEDERRTPDEEAQRIKESNEEALKREEESKKRAEEHQRIVAKLRQDYPWAAPAGGKLSPHARAAANMREELKREFPGIKFSVRSETFAGGDAIDVHWDLGPTVKEVDAIVQKYKEGSFNGMIDLYEYDSSPEASAVREVLGDVKYVHSHRGLPDGVMHELAVKLAAAAHIPFPENIHSGWVQISGGGQQECLSTHVHRMIQRQSFPPGAILGDVEFDENECEYVVRFTAPESPPAAASGGTGSYRIEKHHHTKHGFDFWIVVPGNRLSEDQFATARRSCEAADGWYSRKWGRCPGGFAFKDEAKAGEWAAANL